MRNAHKEKIVETILGSETPKAAFHVLQHDPVVVLDVVPEGKLALEPIASIDPVEAPAVSDQRWTTFIELLVSDSAASIKAPPI